MMAMTMLRLTMVEMVCVDVYAGVVVEVAIKEERSRLRCGSSRRNVMGVVEERAWK